LSPPASAEPETTAHPGTLDLTLRVEGMWCPACAWVIDHSLNRLPGVAWARTHFALDTLQCRYDPLQVTPDAVRDQVARLGYRATAPDNTGHRTQRRELIRFAVSALFSVNVMMLSYALYAGFFVSLDPSDIQKLSWPICCAACVPFFWGGAPIHRRAISALRHGSTSMETLISLASASAFFYSLYNLASASLHLYFDTASMLITLTLLGKHLETGEREKMKADLDRFASLFPGKVKRISPGFPMGRYEPVDRLGIGDLFVVEAGEIAPADGIIESGDGQVDLSLITGESLPVRKSAADRLTSGSRVLTGTFRVRAQAVGPESTLGQMGRIIAQTLSGKTPFEGRTDRWLRAFVPGIIGLSALTGLCLLIQGLSLPEAMERAITVMVISCPCALGIAIPLARVAGIALAASRGILIRDFSAIEKMGRVDTLVFDKTGTLTEGVFTLLNIQVFPPHDETTALAVAAGLESAADHPVGAALRQAAAHRGVPPMEITESCAAGQGVTGIWNGHRIRLGAEGFAHESGGMAPEKTGEFLAATRVYMTRDGAPFATFVLGDGVRGGVRNLVERLLMRGYAIALISGDGVETTQAVGQEIGIACSIGGQTPLDKHRYVADRQRMGGCVLMAGDGINDAPAMAQADISVSFWAGQALADTHADITLMRPDPRLIDALIPLAGTVNRIGNTQLLSRRSIAGSIVRGGWGPPRVPGRGLAADGMPAALPLLHGSEQIPGDGAQHADGRGQLFGGVDDDHQNDGAEDDEDEGGCIDDVIGVILSPGYHCQHDDQRNDGYGRQQKHIHPLVLNACDGHGRGLLHLGGRRLGLGRYGLARFLKLLVGHLVVELHEFPDTAGRGLVRAPCPMGCQAHHNADSCYTDIEIQASHPVPSSRFSLLSNSYHFSSIRPFYQECHPSRRFSLRWRHRLAIAGGRSICSYQNPIAPHDRSTGS